MALPQAEMAADIVRSMERQRGINHTQIKALSIHNEYRKCQTMLTVDIQDCMVVGRWRAVSVDQILMVDPKCMASPMKDALRD